MPPTCGPMGGFNQAAHFYYTEIIMATAGNIIIKILIDNKHAKAEITDVEGVTRKVRKKVQQETDRMQSAFAGVANFGQKLFFTIQGFSSAFSSLEGLAERANIAEASKRKLAATSKLLGTSLEGLQTNSAAVQEQFGLNTVQSNELTIQMEKLFEKAGATGDKVGAVGHLLDLAAAQGYNATEAMTAIQQAMLGIDEGTDKLFGANPSVLYERWAASVGTTVGKMNDQQKAQALLNALVEDGAKVGGEYVNFLNSEAGIASKRAAQIEEIQAKFGQLYLQIKNIVFEVAAPLVDFLLSMDQSTLQFTATLGALLAAGLKIGPMIKGIDAGVKLLGVSIKGALGWIGLIVAAVAALYTAYKTNFMGIGDALDTFWRYTKAVFSAAGEVIKVFMERVKGYFGSFKEMFLGLVTLDFSRIKAGFKGLTDSLASGWGESMDRIQAKFNETLNEQKERPKEVTQVHQEEVNKRAEISTQAVQQEEEINKKAAEEARKLTELRIANIKDEQQRKLAEVEDYYAQEQQKYANNAEILAELEIAKEQKIADIRQQYRDKELQAQQQQEELYQQTIEKRWQLVQEQNILAFETFNAGYDTFWQTLTEREMTWAERLKAVWQNLTATFIQSYGQRLKEYILMKIKEKAVFAQAETGKTAIQKANDAARAASSAAASAKEKSSILGSMGAWLKNIAVKVFSWFASKGPLGIALGVAAVGGVIALVKNVVGGIKGFATGGRVDRPTLGLVGEAGPEIIAPEKDFKQVVAGMGLSNSDVLNKLGNIESALKNLHLKFDGYELALAVDNGNAIMNQGRIG